LAQAIPIFADGDVLLAKVTPCFENGKAGIARDLSNGIGFGSSEFYVLRPGEQALAQWVYHCMMHPSFRIPAVANMTGTGGLQRVPRDFVERFEIPLPPLEVQREIVAEIEGYQKVIDGARAVLENYRPHIPIDPAWPVVELGDVCSFASGGTPSKANDAYWSGQIPWVSAKDLKVDQIHDAGLHVSDEAVAESATHMVPVGSLLVLVRGMGLANGVPVCEVMVPCAFNQDLKALLPNADMIHSRFLAFALRQQDAYFEKVLETAAHGTLKLNSDALRKTSIPLPPLETQSAIVAEIEAEQSLVAANREIIARFEKKIEAAIARVWGGAEEPAAA
jgi:type I restriction enzyme M protein